MSTAPRTLRVAVGEESVGAVHYPAAAPSARVTLVLGHGAGADQSSDFLVAFAGALAMRGLDIITFNFLYSEQRRGAPDRAPKLEACYRAVVEAVRKDRALDGNALALGGKSMGGRIASQIAAAGVDGLGALVFLGYPLHPPKQPEKLRAAHLAQIRLPMLFVQGERDAFGTPAELAPILAPLTPPPRVYAVQGGDHSLKVPKRDGGGPAIFSAVQDEIVRWLGAELRR